MFNHSFHACASYFLPSFLFFFLSFSHPFFLSFFLSFPLGVEISLRTLIPRFMPGSVHSGSASRDDCGRMFPDKLRVSSLPDMFLHYAWTGEKRERERERKKKKETRTTAKIAKEPIFSLSDFQ